VSGQRVEAVRLVHLDHEVLDLQAELEALGQAIQPTRQRVAPACEGGATPQLRPQQVAGAHALGQGEEALTSISRKPARDRSGQLGIHRQVHEGQGEGCLGVLPERSIEGGGNLEVQPSR
jgi:hypothetical protein